MIVLDILTLICTMVQITLA